MAIDKTKNHPAPVEGDLTSDRIETLGKYLRKGVLQPIGTDADSEAVSGLNNDGIEQTNRQYPGKTTNDENLGDISSVGTNLGGTRSFEDEHKDSEAFSKFSTLSYHEGESNKPFDIPEKGKHELGGNPAYQILTNAVGDVRRRGLSNLLSSNRFKSVMESAEDSFTGDPINGGQGKTKINENVSKAFAPEIHEGNVRERTKELFTIQNPGTFNREWQWRDPEDPANFGRYNPDARTYSTEQLAKLSLILQIIATEDIEGKDKVGSIPRGLDKLKNNLALAKNGALLGGGFSAITDPTSGKIDLNKLQEIMEIIENIDDADFPDSLSKEGLQVTDDFNKRTFSQLNSFQEPFHTGFNLPMITTGLGTMIILLVYAAVVGLILDLLLLIGFLVFIPTKHQMFYKPILKPADGSVAGRSDRRMRKGARRGLPLEYNQSLLGTIIFGDDGGGDRASALTLFLFQKLGVMIPEAILEKQAQATGGYFTFTIAALFGTIQLLMRTLVDSGGFITVIGRQAIRDASAIQQASASSSGPIEGMFNLIDAFAASSTFRFINVLFSLGDIFQAERTKRFSPSTLYKEGHKRGYQYFNIGTHSGGQACNNAFLLPGQLMLAAKVKEYMPINGNFNADSANELKGFASGLAPINESAKKLQKSVVHHKDMTGTGRLPDVLIHSIEEALHSSYMPFYFRDMRTNEIISFNAFLEGISDSYTAGYSKVAGFGRMDPVAIYNSTQRSMALTFHIAAANPEDFDAMWIKINKLTTLVYPQWSEGSTKEDYTGAKFIQPFSQVPTSSPLIRMRVGDLFTSNMSEHNLLRLYGVHKIKGAELASFYELLEQVVASHQRRLDSILLSIRNKTAQARSRNLSSAPGPKNAGAASAAANEISALQATASSFISKHLRFFDVKIDPRFVGREYEVYRCVLQRNPISGENFLIEILKDKVFNKAPTNSVMITTDGFTKDGWELANFTIFNKKDIATDPLFTPKYAYIICQFRRYVDFGHLYREGRYDKYYTYVEAVEDQIAAYRKAAIGYQNKEEDLRDVSVMSQAASNAMTGLKLPPAQYVAINRDPMFVEYETPVETRKGKRKKDSPTVRDVGNKVGAFSTFYSYASTVGDKRPDGHIVAMEPMKLEAGAQKATAALKGDETRCILKVDYSHLDVKLNYGKILESYTPPDPAKLPAAAGAIAGGVPEPYAGPGELHGELFAKDLHEIPKKEIKKFQKLLEAQDKGVDQYFYTANTQKPMNLGAFFSSNNALFKAINSSGGRGIAGHITSMNFDWNKGTWEIKEGSRAPKYCTVQIAFSPIHDIAPGIAHDGFNRAPIYGVGPSMSQLQGNGAKIRGYETPALPPVSRPGAELETKTDEGPEEEELDIKGL